MADPAYIDDDGALTDGEAWVGLATTTFSSTVSSVTFTSTDDGQVGDWCQYLDLILIFYKRSAASGGGYTYMTLNGDSSAKYSNQYFQGSGSSTSAGVQNAQSGAWISREIYSGAETGAFDAGLIHFFDINSGKYKDILSHSFANTSNTNSQGDWVAHYANTYHVKDPITSMTIPPYGGTGWAAGSMFSLFGVLPRMVQ
mgnify:CR=1 FL=1